ncbi:MAG: hypothetical protein HY518_03795 [Candidatus Aenigmarchaeota archaeon]|nr:hypothetical protein [Candidatus Aenigmarchaeota archaeon]
MIFTNGDFEKDRSWHIMSPAIAEEHRIISPRIVRGKELLEGFHWRALLPEEKAGYERHVQDTLSQQPASVDVLLKEFTNAEGRKLEYPFLIPPEGTVIGHWHRKDPSKEWDEYEYHHYHIGPDSLLCVETRSGFARKGLACLGFYKEHGDPHVFMRRRGQLSFVLRNYSPNTFAVEGPFSPVQISATVDKEGFIFDKAVRIMRAGRDVTEESRVEIGKFTAYKVSLSEEAVYMRSVNEPISLLGNGVEGVAVRTKMDELHRIRPGFCLTITEEEVHTNGCPAYIYPFHYRDANSFYLYDTYELAESFQRIFSGRDYMPVTANAGLINPDVNGRVVCENITNGRDLGKYLVPHEPYALVIPVPFLDGGADTASYKRSHNSSNQDSISF